LHSKFSCKIRRAYFFWQRIPYATFFKQRERRERERSASKDGFVFIKLKKKFTLEEATKAEKGSRGITLLFPRR
jgi:hypothetical protein